MYSSPRFTIDQYKLLSSPNISRIARLDFKIAFYRFPQITNNTQADISMPKWKSICQTMAGMPNLTELRITIRQTYFFVEQAGTPSITYLVIGVLEPLKQIKVRGGREAYSVRIGWTLEDEERAGLGECPFTIEEIGLRAFGGALPHNDHI